MIQAALASVGRLASSTGGRVALTSALSAGQKQPPPPVQESRGAAFSEGYTSLDNPGY